MIRKQCKKCRRSISSNNYQKHINSCGVEKYTFHIEEDWKIDINQYKCPICSNVYTRKGMSGHIWRKHGEGQNHKSGGSFLKNGKPWNKGLTKDTNEIIRIKSEKQSHKIKEQIRLGLFIPNKMGEAARKRTSLRQTLHNNGGRCKWFMINGQKVQGTWERDLALLMSYLDIIWKKLRLKKDVFEYIINDKIRHYTPDFYLPEYDLYLEVKGYWWGNDREKMRLVYESNPTLKQKCIVVQKELFYILLDSNTKKEFYGALV